MNNVLSTARSLRELVEAEADATDRELTMTAPSCPFGETLAERVDVLADAGAAPTIAGTPVV